MRRGGLLVVLLVMAALTTIGCSGESDEARTARCVDLGDDVRETVESAVEAVIWENRLFKTDRPIPKKLLDGKKPIPLAGMTDAQRGEYLMWKRGNEAFLDTTLPALNDARDRALSLNVVDSCVGSPDSDEPETECIHLAEDVHDAVIVSVEQLIWEHGLYESDRSIPKELIRGGKRESIFEMDDRERDLYDGWKMDNRAFARSTEVLLNRTDASAQALDIKDRCLNE